MRSREVLTTGQDEEISAMFSKTEEQQMKQRAVIEKNKVSDAHISLRCISTKISSITGQQFLQDGKI